MLVERCVTENLWAFFEQYGCKLWASCLAQLFKLVAVLITVLCFCLPSLKLDHFTIDSLAAYNKFPFTQLATQEAFSAQR